MGIAYFAKKDPRVKVVIATGESVQFEAVSWDEGVYPRAEDQGISDFLIEQLRLCIQRQVGGLREISRDEFLALLKKKQTEPDGMEPPSREELLPRLQLNRRPNAPGAAPRVAVDMHNGAQVMEVGSISPAGIPAPAPEPVIPRPTASKPALPR